MWKSVEKKSFIFNKDRQSLRLLRIICRFVMVTNLHLFYTSHIFLLSTSKHSSLLYTSYATMTLTNASPCTWHLSCYAFLIILRFAHVHIHFEVCKISVRLIVQDLWYMHNMGGLHFWNAEFIDIPLCHLHCCIPQFRILYSYVPWTALHPFCLAKHIETW